MRNRLSVALRSERVATSDDVVAARLDRLLPGFESALKALPAYLARFVVDRASGDHLFWAEQQLDHGDAGRGVELGSGIWTTTRADILGIYWSEDGDQRVVVQDYKTGKRVADPRFDNGFLARAIWALAELQAPRAQWFLSGRVVEATRDGVDLEAVNLLHADGDEFRTSCFVSRGTLDAERARLSELLTSMGTVSKADDHEVANPMPGGLCASYCPWLNRCGPGQDYVSKYAGRGVLADRLAGRAAVLDAADDEHDE
jgi:hypothetical protein